MLPDNPCSEPGTRPYAPKTEGDWGDLWDMWFRLRTDQPNVLGRPDRRFGAAEAEAVRELRARWLEFVRAWSEDFWALLSSEVGFLSAEEQLRLRIHDDEMGSKRRVAGDPEFARLFTAAVTWLFAGIGAKSEGNPGVSRQAYDEFVGFARGVARCEIDWLDLLGRMSVLMPEGHRQGALAIALAYDRWREM